MTLSVGGREASRLAVSNGQPAADGGWALPEGEARVLPCGAWVSIGPRSEPSDDKKTLLEITWES